MHKYISVVNHRMDDDDISHLIGQGIAGALFQINHQDYSRASKLIALIQKLAKKYNRPISIIQDVSDMQDPMDLEFGTKSGVHWVATDKVEHVKMARGLNKLASVIFKGRNLPKKIKVDSVLAEGFLDPDAHVIGSNHKLKHIISDHKNQKILDSLLHFSQHASSNAIAVADLELAKALSFRRPSQKIIFAPKDAHLASKSSLFWGVHPIFRGSDLISSLKNSHVV
jgi:pyruvate kinase